MSTGNHGPVSGERAIENLISSYAFVNDDADIAGLGELFADAVFTLDETTARGREEIEQRARGNVGRASYDQKPDRRTMMETRGPTVHTPPPRATTAGAKIRAHDPP